MRIVPRIDAWLIKLLHRFREGAWKRSGDPVGGFRTAATVVPVAVVPVAVDAGSERVIGRRERTVP